MKRKHKPVITAVIVLAALDFAGVIAMIVWPDFVPRLIPALVGVQLLGFIVIAITSMSATSTTEEESSSNADSSSVSSDWKFWLVGGFALLFFLRALLAIAYMAGRGWHGYQALVPGAGFLIACYLLYLAYRIRKRATSKE